MTEDEARTVVARLAGYWPQPTISVEESAAWKTELTSQRLHITAEEATHVIRAEAESGREWRPRPGEIVALVQALRRQRALANPLPEIDRSVPELEVTTERRTREEWVKQIRLDVANAHGPLVGPLAAVLGVPKPKVSSRYPADSARSRALARAQAADWAAVHGFSDGET